MKTNMTIKQATERMIHFEMNAIPQTLLEKAYYDHENYEGIMNITPNYVGQYVTYEGEEYTVSEINVYGEEDKIHITQNDIIHELVYASDIDREFGLPMWSTLWQTTGFLTSWVERNLEKVASCGFQIYEVEDLDGYLLGINGAGYDFYESHWIPLYNAQGLKWHTEEVEV